MTFLIWLGMIGLIVLYTFQSLFTKLYTDKYPGDPAMASSVLTVVSGLSVVLITFFCFSSCRFDFNVWSILIGVLNAIALYSYNYFIVKASSSGPYSIVMMFNLSGGIIIPIVASLIMGWDSAWSTPFLSILNATSIFVIIASVYMVSRKNGDEESEKGVSPGFIFSCFGLALSNGAYGLFLTLQQQSPLAGAEANRDEMVIVTFLVAALLAFITGTFKAKREFLSCFRQTKASLVFLIVTSLAFALAINVLVILLPYFDTTIFYTIDNSSVLIMSVLISAIFFKEKLSRLNVIGIILMCTALVSMNLLPAIVG